MRAAIHVARPPRQHRGTSMRGAIWGNGSIHSAFHTIRKVRAPFGKQLAWATPLGISVSVVGSWTNVLRSRISSGAPSRQKSRLVASAWQWSGIRNSEGYSIWAKRSPRELSRRSTIGQVELILLPVEPFHPPNLPIGHGSGKGAEWSFLETA